MCKRLCILLDHVYTTDRKHVALFFISNIAFSDHFPVGVVWRKPVTKSCNYHRYISYSKPINYDSYEIKYYLQSLINSIYYMKNPHNMVNVLNNAIVSVKSSLPNTKRVKRQKQPKWYNRQIKEASIKRYMYKKYNIFDKYRHWRNQVCSLIKLSKRNYYRQMITDCSGNIGRVWKVLSELSDKQEQ